ncbi:MAG: B12-binding domain-containing radical SAM protein [Deltaproteobacteria bacterium]|nr:B12-binding domain-containing radical SAM protein [Deltaproteobacteria bacterium]
MRLALIQPPTNYVHASCLLEPIGLGYVGAACRHAGHEVLLRDVIDPSRDAVSRLVADLDAFRPAVVGFSTMTETHSNGVALARLVKRRYGVPVVFGGWHVSGEPSAALDPAIDVVVRGEGEEAMVELLAALGRGGGPGLHAIEGLAFRDAGGALVLTAQRRRLKKLTELPFPMRDGLPLERYQFHQFLCTPVSRARTLSVQASRGCPYTCSFCQTPALWGAAWTRRTPSDVVDEIEMLVDRHAIDSLFFRDEEFTVRPTWVIEICDELVRRGLQRRLKWGAFCRADEMNEDLAHAMSAAGCVYGFLGLESGDTELRERIRKTYASEDAERALSAMRAHGILSHAGWIIGFPTDTRASLERSFRWFRRLPLDLLSIVFATPFGGTAFLDEVRAAGLLASEDTDLYSTKEPVVNVPGIPLDELRALPDRFLRRFYLRPSQAVRLASTVLRAPAARGSWPRCSRARCSRSGASRSTGAAAPRCAASRSRSSSPRRRRRMDPEVTIEPATGDGTPVATIAA